MWIAARSSAAAVSKGGRHGCEPAVSLNPDVLRPVDHDFAHVRIGERGLEAGQKRCQEIQPVAAHRRP